MTGTKQIRKWLLGAALVGASVLAVPHQAQAQVSFGVAVNAYPAAGVYVPADGYYAPNDWQRREYIEHERWEARRAAEFRAAERREQWERCHDRDRDDWRGRDGWRDNDGRRDRDSWRDRDDWHR